MIVTNKWKCIRLIGGRICLSPDTMTDENGIYLCNRCRAVLEVGEGSAKCGAGEVNDCPAQVAAHKEYEANRARSLGKKAGVFK